MIFPVPVSCLLSVSTWSVWLSVFPSEDRQVCLWIFFTLEIIATNCQVFIIGEISSSSSIISTLSWMLLGSIFCLKASSFPRFCICIPLYGFTVLRNGFIIISSNFSWNAFFSFSYASRIAAHTNKPDVKESGSYH